MAKRRIQQSDEEIALRAIRLARQIEGRVFASHEGVFLVRGAPVFDKLFHCLRNCHGPPDGDCAPVPAALGFSPSETVALSSGTLGTWARALQKWRKILDDYEKPQQKTAVRRRKYRAWREEIEDLSCRLSRFQEVRRDWDDSRLPENAPYVLPATEGISLCSALDCGLREGVRDPFWK